MRQYFNWKTYLVLMAMAIVGASLYYTNQLAHKLAVEETKRVQLLVQAIRASSNIANEAEVEFAFSVIAQNNTIPLIIADSADNIIDNKNIKVREGEDATRLLRDKLQEFKKLHSPVVADLGFGLGKTYVYYGESYLLTQLRYFPYVQLAIIIVFLIVVLIALTSAHRSLQNQVWVGLSKETAHQLGTPLSSIEGWLELLKEHEENAEAVVEMRKDLNRLKLVADRFSKVGSTPQLEVEDVMQRLENMVQYMQKRAPSKVRISIETNEKEIPVLMSGPLFDWVVENLMRNALDAMEGKGRIDVRVTNEVATVRIDVCDTGKGIPKHQIKSIFKPGFTTKKRGWGLGLSLSKRIIEKYHHGSLLVRQSEPGKGTTFRIILRR